MKLDFACTGCGRCCHGLRLALTVPEALRWLDSGDEVQVLCQALPWPEATTAAADPAMAYLLGRSASGRSGSLPVRWLVTLVAHFSGPCPNLQADLRCGAYATRPLVCRIYPAEINPFRPTMPAHKACPEEAWATGQAPMARAGVIVDATLRADIAASRAADREEACVKAAACTRLGLTAAALIHEGFVVHRPAPEGLHAALSELSAALQMEPVKLQAEAHSLQLVSENAASLEWLAELGADTLAANDPALQAASYLGAVGAVSA